MHISEPDWSKEMPPVPEGVKARWRESENQATATSPSKPLIRATPFVWRDPKSIPLRPWVYGRWLLRHCITAVVAPGGVGKSSFMASTILALASGRELLGKTIWDGPQRAWYWNLEDDGDELARQLQAAARYHGVTAEDCADRLFVDSGLDGAGLCIAVEGQRGHEILRPVVEALVAELKARRIDVLIVDPFVSSHAVSENDNGAINAVAKEWAKVAKRAGCSIVLVHHTKKLDGKRVSSETSRGAVSLIDAARATLVLNRMDPDEANRFAIDGDDERRRYFNVQDDKANRAPAEKADWYRIASVDLGNAEDGRGDSVGVVTLWAPPDLMEGITQDTLYQVQNLVAARQATEHPYRDSSQANDWVGKAVAEVLGISAASDDKIARAKINRLLKMWIANRALVKFDAPDGQRRMRASIKVGNQADPSGAPLP